MLLFLNPNFKCNNQRWIAPFDEGLTKTNYYSIMIFLPLFIYYYDSITSCFFYKAVFYFWVLFNFLFLKAVERLGIIPVDTTSQYHAISTFKRFLYWFNVNLLYNKQKGDCSLKYRRDDNLWTCFVNIKHINVCF